MVNSKLFKFVLKAMFLVLHYSIQLFNKLSKKDRFQFIAFDDNLVEWVIGELVETTSPIPVYVARSSSPGLDLVTKGVVLLFKIMVDTRTKEIRHIILVDKLFFEFFTEQEREAILSHELGHFKLGHLELSMKNRIMYQVHHEVLADAHAIRHGYGKALKTGLTKLTTYLIQHKEIRSTFTETRAEAIAAILGGTHINVNETILFKDYGEQMKEISNNSFFKKFQQ